MPSLAVAAVCDRRASLGFSRPAGGHRPPLQVLAETSKRPVRAGGSGLAGLTALMALLILLASGFGLQAEVLPPAPAHWFNDYAGVVAPAVAQRLDQTLQDFERQKSSQIVVAIFPKMQSDSSVEDYTVRVAQSWHVGQKDKDNGAVLFVFVAEHKLYVQVGYGLEGALPDALCKRIIQDEIVPHLHGGDFNGGMTAGVTALLAVAKGEYQGTGQTAGESRHQLRLPPSEGGIWLVAAFFLFFVFFVPIMKMLAGGRSVTYSRGGYVRRNSGGVFLGGGGWGGGGGGFSGGGGGGGFSGGGGSFGGGGAGGSW